MGTGSLIPWIFSCKVTQATSAVVVEDNEAPCRQPLHAVDPAIFGGVGNIPDVMIHPLKRESRWSHLLATHVVHKQFDGREPPTEDGEGNL